MILKKITSEGLSHNSYFISAGGHAAVVDPRRDVDEYLDLARKEEARIEYIFETHRNEDYVIGSLELAARSGALILHGHQMDFAYGKPVKEGDCFRLGPIELKVLETPGHTMESISVVLTDHDVSQLPSGVFTGDTLFAGDAGRTDFFGEKKRPQVSAMLYDSITQKLLPLGDQTVIFPAHGAGSICGSEISDREFSTIGYEKKANPLLALSREEFIRRKVTEHHYLPPYFRMMEKYNQEGAPVVHHLPDPKPFGVEELRESQSSAQIVDIRSPTSFATGHIPGSLSIWREGLPEFMGWFLNYGDPIILVDDFNCNLGEITRHFMRLGYDNFAGYLAGGFPAWLSSAAPIGKIAAWTVHELARRRETSDIFLLDVRDIKNVNRTGIIPGAHHIYIGELPQKISEVPESGQVTVYCDVGFKGSLGASILARNGYKDIANILGGITAWKSAGLPVAKPP
ncbi:MAG TPA: rhodanese-like domain-containing protein [Methanoregulaceae archaeon]|nr:MAG: MBL fold metallo-hydrolase [Methanolinea sp.]HON81727.1 rhodanese-like domain-containing protein [Methanoregulaceae archaeon]HPD10466.1 rhodanese-like domain-containing protein [Methanoregulaceae archaeon]HRT15485.1 rhodanese-like domain-containing protein [Methanoregulaceae archaeon]HRU31125.1 rhodanese-like domain-containing protein [Methanoregulaceae archaeon]